MPRDELVVLIEQPPKSLDPRTTGSSYDFKLSFLCYARLVSVDSDRLEPVGDLAERIDELPRDERGALPFQVTLRPARFSDGSPVTAADVVYSFQAVLDPKSGNPVLRRRFEDAGLILPVEALDPRTVRLRFAHAHASVRTDLDFGILKQGSLEAGRPIGAGPFVLQGPVGEVTRFTRNPYYYGGAPPMAALTVRVVRDANSRLLSLVGGSADLTQNTLSPLLLDVVGRFQDRLKLETAPSAIFFYLGLNTTDPLLKDPRVRQALALALDRERIIEKKLHGRGVVATGMLPTLHWAYDGQVTRYQRDLPRARALLDQAGFPDPDGDGPLPRFSLTYRTSTDALPVSIARIVAAQLAEVGVQVAVRPYEFHVFLSDVKKGNFQIFGLSSGEVAEPNLLKRYFHSRFMPTPQNLDAGHNRMRYHNPEVDALLDAGERELAREERRRLYGRLQRILADELPIIPMWHVDNIAVMRKEVQGFRLWPSAQLSSLSKVSK